MGRNGNMSVMTCGACAVVMDGDGQMTTSVDVLVSGMKRLFGKHGHGVAAKNVDTAVSR